MMYLRIVESEVKIDGVDFSNEDRLINLDKMIEVNKLVARSENVDSEAICFSYEGGTEFLTVNFGDDKAERDEHFEGLTKALQGNMSMYII